MAVSRKPLKFTVREALPEDAAEIRRVVESAFGRSGEADLVENLIRGGRAVVNLVACEAVTSSVVVVVGHALLSRLVLPSPACLALAPVSVSPEYQGRGVGSELVRRAVSFAKDPERRFEAVFVVGDAGFYSRFGFSAKLARGFESRYSGDHFLALEVSPGTAEESGRTVAFPEEFSGF